MKWFIREKISKKSLSIIGSLTVVMLFSAYFFVPQKNVRAQSRFSSQDKQVVSKQSHETVKKTYKKLVKPKRHKKELRKSIVKKDKKVLVVEQAKKLIVFKKPLKYKQRMVAYNARVKMRAAADLSMDNWNLQHEQIETLTENVGDDPVGASAFEKKKLEEELSAAGI